MDESAWQAQSQTKWSTDSNLPFRKSAWTDFSLAARSISRALDPPAYNTLTLIGRLTTTKLYHYFTTTTIIEPGNDAVSLLVPLVTVFIWPVVFSVLLQHQDQRSQNRFVLHNRCHSCHPISSVSFISNDIPVNTLRHSGLEWRLAVLIGNA